MKSGSFDNIIDWIFDTKKYRYYFALLVILGIVFTLVRCTDTTAHDENPMAGAYSSYKEEKKDSDSELTELMNTYYKAYAEGDLKSIKNVATPITDKEASYIAFFSEYVESYDNVKVYSKRGLKDDSYLVSVSMDIKFKGVDTAASGLDFFYVSTDKNGKLYINNVYSNFNTNNNENEMDQKVVQLIAAFEQQDDVQALQAEIQQKFNEAMLNDEKLNAFLSTTLPEASKTWATKYQELADEKEAKRIEEEKKKAEEEAAKKQKEEDEKNKVILYAKESINVLDAANGQGNVIGALSLGDEVSKYADEGDYSRIAFGDGNGYVETAKLVSEKPSESDEVEVAGVTPGAKIKVKNTTKVRKGMSTDTDVVATLNPGATITVGKNFATGWTSVTTASGKTGYIRSDLLQH